MDHLSAQWGFHPGGWGKPPLDEYNRPLYGDVFGVLPKNTDADVSLETGLTRNCANTPLIEW